MKFLLSPLASAARDRPRWVIVVAVVLTAVFGVFASDQTTDTELTSFAPDSEAATALTRTQEEFGGGGEALQVIVDAGVDGNVWSSEGLTAAATVENVIAEHVDESGAEIADVTSFARPVIDALAAEGATLATATDAELDAAVRSALEGGAGQLVSLEDESEASTAQAGIVVVSFPPELDVTAVDTTSVAIAAAVDGIDVGSIELSPFNQYVLAQTLQEQSESEMAVLLGLSLLLILVILLFQYRNVSDVLIGLAGLVAAIIWMMGIGVILGPEYLGVIGPFSQIATIVPVLLVGLGIDYAIHITSRYREERSHGVTPDRSAAMAVRTVGGALALATATTTAGFLTNLFSPLPPLADFGVFTAVGVLSAFVIMTAVVPAARNVLDTRRARRGGSIRTARPSAGLSALIGRAAILSERAPRIVIGVALGLSVVAAGAATQVSTTFGQDDFIPDGSDIDLLLDRMEELFAGDVNEITYVVIDGDLTEPATIAAIVGFDDEIAGVDNVRTTNGRAQVSSPATLIAATAAAAPDAADQFAVAGYTLDGFADQPDLDVLYGLAGSVDPGGAAGIISGDRTTALIAIGTTAGQEGANALADALDPMLDPLRAAGLTATITSELLVVEESLDALTASQTRGIIITLVAALLLLVGYYGFAERKPLLGVITMIPSLAVVTWVLGTMWALDISFNVLTAMVASLGIGIGVPYGIHITHRFLEDRRRYETIDDAIRHTVRHTGGAMAGSAATTAGGFGVLIFASLIPIQQFGLIVALTIIYSFIAAVLIQPSCLKLWAELRARRGDHATLLAHELRDIDMPTPELAGRD